MIFVPLLYFCCGWVPGWLFVCVRVRVQMTASLRAAEDEKRRAEIEADVCKKGEARLAEQISQLREELKRQQQVRQAV